MSGRVGKLSFKGDPSFLSSKTKKKKRKRSEHEFDRHIDGNGSSKGWVQATSVHHLVGPMLIIFPGTALPSTLYNANESTNVVLRALDQYVDIDPDSLLDFQPSLYEPSDVHEVFVIHKLVGSSTGEDRWSIKSAEGRFLSSEKDNTVTCASEAIGPKEEWNPIFDPTTHYVAFQSVWGKYLTVVEPNDKRSEWQLRIDGQEVGFCQWFYIKVQAEIVYQHRNHLTKQLGHHDDGDDDQHLTGITTKSELDAVKKYQSWASGRIRTAVRDEAELEQAKKNGKLAQALLDRRAMQKSDKYCK